MRTIVGGIALFFGMSVAIAAGDNDVKLQKRYYAYKQAKYSVEKKGDSIFIVLYHLSNSNSTLSEKLAKDFLAYAKRERNPFLLGKANMACAVSHFYRGSYLQTIPVAKQAIVYLKQTRNEIDLCFTLQLLAASYNKSDNYDMALQTSSEALSIAKRLNNNVLIANTYNEMGILQSSKHNYVLAKKYFHKALSISTQDKDEKGMQTQYTNLGIAFKNLKEYDSAFYFQRKALQKALTLNETYRIAYAYNDLGALYLATNDYKNASSHLLMAVKMRRELGEEWELGYSLNYLGEVYRKTRQKSKSLVYLREALELSKKNGNTKQYYETCEQLGITFSSFGQYDSAYYYYQKFAQVRDSIVRLQNNLAAESLIADYEFEKNQQEIQLLKEKSEVQHINIEKQRNWLWFIGLISVMLAGLTLLIARNRALRIAKLRLESKRKEEQLRKEAQVKIHQDRRRISRELHDNIGANLTVVKELISGINDSSGTTEIRLLTEETIQELRKSVWLLNNDETTLEEWVIRLRTYFQHLPKITIVFTANDSANPKTTSAKLTELFRVIQEGVNNALKHASCTSIMIHIAYLQEKDQLFIELKDDGAGWSNETNEGFGLENMKERIRGIQGDITFVSEKGQGTSIRITVHLMEE